MTANLAQAFNADSLEHLQLLHTSHAPLVVVYNLGCLPNSEKDAIMKVEPTLLSLVDALLQRLGLVAWSALSPTQNRAWKKTWLSEPF
jgi:hypothetical protein